MRSADDYQSNKTFAASSPRAGIFTVFSPRIRVVANSQDTFRLWIRIRKLEATTTRRRRGSPVCKKELSSNRINDPLASIYRTRREGRHGGTRRRDVQGRTRRTVFQRGRSGSCFSTSSFCRALPPCAENIICFLTVLGSLCRRRKFNRARTPPPDGVCKSCFRLHPFARMRDVGPLRLSEKESIL